jgi:hypothetical protein
MNDMEDPGLRQLSMLGEPSDAERLKPSVAKPRTLEEPGIVSVTRASGQAEDAGPHAADKERVEQRREGPPVFGRGPPPRQEDDIQGFIHGWNRPRPEALGDGPPS